MFYSEVWTPKSRRMLNGLLQKHKKSGVILISGDVHYGGYFAMKCKGHFGYEMPEITTSGLTHTLDTHVYRATDCVQALTNDFYFVRAD